MFDKAQLENLTKQYWEDHAPDPKNPYREEEGYNWYIQELLPHEMDYASSLGRLPQEMYQNLLLVLLVGHSLEPLLQTVWSYRPAQVLLITNQDYGIREGNAQANLVKWAIEKIRPSCKVFGLDNLVAEATPAGTFSILLQNERVKSHLRENLPVIVDITGAKKSMMAGAFLFAAFANVPVSYVDFDDDKYEPEKGRPYGFACKIGPFKNPYDQFALRDWEQVRDLYRRYKFRDARMLLAGEYNLEKYLPTFGYSAESGTIWHTMKDVLPTSVPCIKIMADILRGYEAWDAGNYELAKKLFQGIAIEKYPSAIEVFGENWVKIDGTKFEIPNEIYQDPAKLNVYAQDELARIERIIQYNLDYRAAYLRAAGLTEVVMRARLIDITTGETREHLLQGVNHKQIAIHNLFSSFVEGKLIPRKGFEISWKGTPITLPIMEPWWKIDKNLFGQDNGWEIFIQHRNKLAHTFVYIPEQWACDALAFACANVNDFMKTKSVGSPVETHAMPWSVLCLEKITGLQTYLTPNLTENLQEKSSCQNT